MLIVQHHITPLCAKRGPGLTPKTTDLFIPLGEDSSPMAPLIWGHEKQLHNDCLRSVGLILEVTAMEGTHNLTQQKSTPSLYRQGWNFQSLQQIGYGLERAKIRYALIGESALTVHGCRPTAQVLDILMMPEGFDRFYQSMVGSRMTARPFSEGERLFWDSRTGLTLCIWLAGAGPEEIAWPMPWEISERIKGLCVASLRAILEHQLTQVLDDRSLQEIATAIYIKNLPREFGRRLGKEASDRYYAIWDLLPFRAIAHVKLVASPWYSTRLGSMA
jgi:hypothetical protein